MDNIPDKRFGYGACRFSLKYFSVYRYINYGDQSSCLQLIAVCTKAFVVLSCLYVAVNCKDKSRALAIRTRFDIRISTPFSILEMYGLFLPTSSAN